MKTGVAVLVKNPGQGEVKTRLARAVGTALAREFYRLCLECLREDLDWLGRHASLEMVICPFSGEDVDWCKRFWEDYPLIPQPSGGLGIRLNVIEEALRQRGFEATILIGSDARPFPLPISCNASKACRGPGQFAAPGGGNAAAPERR